MKKKQGRPEIFIDWKLVEGFCMSQSSQEEIAAYLCLSVDTLERACRKEHKKTFAEFFNQKKKRGFLSLRHKQYQLAIQGNVTMLIWLGKQYLGQSDRQQVESNVVTTETQPVFDLKKLKEQIKQMKAISEISVTTISKE